MPSLDDIVRDAGLIRRTHRRYGWRADIPDPRDRLYAAPTPVLRALPPSAQTWVPDAFDQDVASSCVGHGVVEALMHIAHVMNIDPEPFSRLFVYYNARMIEGEPVTDSGCQIRDAIRGVATLGAPPESAWPYAMLHVNERPYDVAYTAASPHKAISYHAVPQSERQIKGCIAEGYPVIFGMTVVESFESEEVAKTGLVPMPTKGENVLGAHCMLLYGYDDASRTYDDLNSWGSGWGQNGSCKLPYDLVHDPNLAGSFWTIRSIAG